ncbi:hypothetical protein HQ531_03775 [bacterium]|nr:hypothetical protein [bacterium]
MDIQFTRPAEAMAAITWVVCTADSIGSIEEHSFIHQKVRKMEIFKGMSQTEFSSLLGSTRTKLFCNLPNDGFCLAQPGVQKVIESANLIFDSTQKDQAISMVIDLAKSDKLVESEEVVIDLIRSGFAAD